MQGDSCAAGSATESSLDRLPLVKAIAIRVHENLPVHVELDDPVHAGAPGLFDAVEKYDSQKKVELQAYDKRRIQGAILDSLRVADWARAICGSAEEGAGGLA